MCGTGSIPAAPPPPPELARAKQVSGASLIARAQRGQFSENRVEQLGLETKESKAAEAERQRLRSLSPLPTGKAPQARRGPLGRAVGKIF